MARVRISVPCPYCRTWQHLDTEQETKAGLWRKLGKLKCDSCDSTFEISLKVNRRGKGKRWKAHEAKQEAEHRAKVAEANERNAKELASWEHLEGCECWKPWPHSAGYDSRPRAPISVTEGIPNQPRHLDKCPHAAR